MRTMLAPERCGEWVRRSRSHLDVLEAAVEAGQVQEARVASLALTDDLKGLRRDLRLPCSLGPRSLASDYSCYDN